MKFSNLTEYETCFWPSHSQLHPIPNSLQVSLDRCASEDTCILYCTTGILLQKLIQDKNLNEYSHIVLDEVHDREADMDFCILVIKQLMRELSSQVIERFALISVENCQRFFRLCLLVGPCQF